MNSVYMILAIPILTILSFVARYYAQLLYQKVYAKHITFEPSISQTSFAQFFKGFVSILIFLPMYPLFLWSQGYVDTDGFYALSGLIIAYLAYPLSHAIFSILFFLYIRSRPNLIRGQTIFKDPAAKIIQITSAIQSIVFLGIIMFFIPSAFLVGAFFGLFMWVITLYVSKKPEPIV